jgi:His/Glu/Gln/Arg/opine family amino acid ABC transporter permease subunit
MFDKIINGFVKTFIAEDRYKMFLSGFWNTIQIAFVATLIGVVIGAIVAIIRVFHKQTGKLRILDKICELYTTIIRGTPVVVQLLITYNIIFAWSTQAVLVGMLGFGLNSGAYVAEIMRGGINAVDIGQTEAGRSLGYNYVQTMIYIIIPQVFKAILPTLCNEFIVLIKETSVAGYVGVMDLTKAGDRIRGITFKAFMPLIAVALIYLVVVVILTQLVNLLERRLRKNER